MKGDIICFILLTPFQRGYGPKKDGFEYMTTVVYLRSSVTVIRHIHGDFLSKLALFFLSATDFLFCNVFQSYCTAKWCACCCWHIYTGGGRDM